MLAVLPLLAMPGADAWRAATRGTPAWIDSAAGVAAGRSWCSAPWPSVVVGGRFVVQPLFRALARTRLREVFTAAALLLVDRHRAADGAGGAEPRARHVPRRRGARHQRVPARTRERHRAVQGAAARPLLPGGGREHRLRAGARAGGHRGGARGRARGAQGAGAVRDRRAVPHGARPEPALHRRARAGRRVRLRAALVRRPERRAARREVANVLVAAIALSMATTPLMLVAYERFIVPRVGTQSAWPHARPTTSTRSRR